MIEKDNFIQLKKDNILKIGIKDFNGNDTGEHLEFDLEDIELLLKYQNMIDKDKKNKEWLKNQLMIIRKRQNHQGKKLLSKNEEDEIKALRDFFNKEVEVYNIFLGEKGVQKLLNGRKINWNTMEEIDEIIEHQIYPLLDKNMDKITEKIKEKYSKASNLKKENEIEVLD